MFIAVTLGYMITVTFATCGAVSTAIYLTELSQQTTRLEFVNGLTAAAMPLAIAAIIFLLTQILVALQKNNILLNHAQQPGLPPAFPPTKTPVPAARKKVAVQQSADDFFNAEAVTLVHSSATPDTTPKPVPTEKNDQQKEIRDFFRVD